MQTIGVCGMGYTGSGAVLDLLSEFDDVEVNTDPEFSFCYTPDGLEDLEYHLVTAPSRYMSSDIAILRFIKLVEGRNNRGSGIRIATKDQFYDLSMAYINSLIQLTWRGYWGWDFNSSSKLRRNLTFRILNNRITPLLGKVLKRNIDLPPVRDMYLSVSPNNFYEASRKYIMDLIRAMGYGNKETIVLNQPFAADHPTKSFPFFENPIAIVVDRDPRDVYVLMKRVTLDAGRFIPTQNVKDFVEYYRIIHEKQEDTNDRSDVIKLQFENLIYRYEEAVADLCSHLNIKEHSRCKQVFKPDVSINNTQLFLKYPQFKEDCNYIAEQLPVWLYPFDSYTAKPNWRNEAF